tara:strand:- start:419 stop:1102 length:684 start_codon:yes stop_codon:yes gene_type:complete
LKKKIIFASSKKWFFKSQKVKNFLKNNEAIIISDKKKLNKNIIKKINPSFIFFPHWSYKVNTNIIKNYNCICFHTAPLPYGRGGSPIQNLIKRNYKKTPICALKMSNKIDAGPIFLKKNISLNGNLDQIFERISSTIIKMVEILIKKKIKPVEQKGKVFFFKRFKKKESEIKNEKNIIEIYNKIRMLDSEEYPKAYIKINKFKFYLSKANIRKNTLSCDAKIIKTRK